MRLSEHGSVLGIDVGYSARRKTTGFCALSWDARTVRWRCENAGVDERNRHDTLRRVLPGGPWGATRASERSAIALAAGGDRGRAPPRRPRGDRELRVCADRALGRGESVRRGGVRPRRLYRALPPRPVGARDAVLRAVGGARAAGQSAARRRRLSAL